MIPDRRELETALVQLAVSRPLFASHSADLRLSIKASCHPIQGRLLYSCIAVQHEQIAPGTDCQRLVDALRETTILLIHDDSYRGEFSSNCFHGVVIRVVVDDDHFESGRESGLEHRLKTVEQQ